MSDFAKTLRQKHAALEKERDQLVEQLKNGELRLRDLNGAIAGITTLLRLEEGGSPAAPAAPKVANGSDQEELDLPKVLKDSLADGRPHSVDELILSAKARGVDFGQKHPVRTVSFTLMGLSRGGKIERTNDGRWRLTG